MQEKQRAFLVRTAYWAVWAVLLWLGVRYLLRWLLPFLLALALAAAVEPVIAWCRRRMGLKRGFTAAVVTIAVTGAILALAAVIVWQLIRQAAELLGQLPGLLAGLPGMTEDLRQRLEDFCAACPQGLRSWLEEVPALLGTLAAGQAPRAVALAALYAVISAVRSLLEPKVMAAQAGLPPLAALAAMYAGFRALGVAGMILLPMALLFVKQLHDEGYVGLWK